MGQLPLSLSHYELVSSKTPGTLEMAKWSCKKSIETFYKTMNFLKSEGDCPRIYRKYMPVLENRSSKFKSNTQKLKKQGVRLGSCHWIISILPWENQSKIPQKMHRGKKSQASDQIKLVTLASQVSCVWTSWSAWLFSPSQWGAISAAWYEPSWQLGKITLISLIKNNH